MPPSRHRRLYFSDAPFNRNLLTALVQLQFLPSDDDQAVAGAIDGINEVIAKVRSELEMLAAKADGRSPDILSELMSYHWLDVAQLERLTEGGRDLFARLKTLRHASFGSRDFWTEITHLDRLGR